MSPVVFQVVFAGQPCLVRARWRRWRRCWAFDLIGPDGRLLAGGIPPRGPVADAFTAILARAEQGKGPGG